MLITAFSVLASGYAAAGEVLQVQYPIAITRDGLDVTSNRLDALISHFGFVCIHNPYNPRPCRIEREVTSLLRALPQDSAVIARELRAMDATCESNGGRLQCIYERDVLTTPWVNSVPSRALKDSFRIEFTATEQHDGSLDFKVTFWRNGRY